MLCGMENHPFELYLALNGIEHRRTKVKFLKTNGFIERFNKTGLDEFFRIASLSKWTVFGASQVGEPGLFMPCLASQLPWMYYRFNWSISSKYRFVNPLSRSEAYKMRESSQLKVGCGCER